jgi:hypothetical protein
MDNDHLLEIPPFLDQRSHTDMVGIDAAPINNGNNCVDDKASVVSKSGLQNVSPDDFIDSIFDGKEAEELVCVTKQVSFNSKSTGDTVNTFINRPMGDPEFRLFQAGNKPADWYVCISSVDIPAKDEKVRRRREDIKFTYCIVLDDVGTKVKEDNIPLPPSWKIETSPDNYQWGYKIDRDDRQAKVEALINALIDKDLNDPGATGVYRVVRLPGSINMKPENNKFPSRLTEWNPQRSSSLEDIASAFGVDISSAVKPKKSQSDATNSKLGDYDDPVLKWLNEKKLSGDDNGKFITVVCPWQVKHTDQNDDSTGYSPIGHGDDKTTRYFNCFHGSHDGEGRKNTADFLDWVAEQGGPKCSNHDAPAWLDEMNERYMVVNEAGKTVVYRPIKDAVLERDYMESSTFEDFKKKYLNDRVIAVTDKSGEPIYKTKADAWLEHPKRKQYLGGVVFAPDQLLPADIYNLWQGFDVDPLQGDWSYLREHILWVICNGDKYLDEYLIGWMANTVQKPGKQGEVAVVMRGGRGTGKGTFANWFGRLFGQHYMYLTNAKHLVGNFNAHLRDAVVVFADEAFFAGDKSHASVLKGMITDPFITIEAKYKNAVTARNIIHLLMASNDDWVVPAGQDERRFCVIELCSAVKQNHKYFEAINKQMENGGLAAMLYDLQKLDLTNFNVRAVPTTSALVDQKVRSLSGPEAWLYDSLQRGEIRHHQWTTGGLVVPKNTAYEDYKDRHKDFRDYTPVGISSWAKSVRSIMRGAVSTSRPEVDGARVRSFVFPPLAQCRDVFLSHLGQENGQDHVWETDDE